MKIVISAGHNPGTDPGAIGQGQQEANENVRIADRVVLLLRSWGADVDYMPNNVGDLQAEINWMAARYKTYESAFAIQIHRNAGGGTGNEVWTSNYKTQWALATTVMKAMTEVTKLPERGVKDVVNNPLGWINYVNCASILVECRFIDRDSITDADDLQDALGVATGIARAVGIPVGKTPEQLAAQVKAEAEAKAAAEAAAKAAEAKRLAEEAAVKAKAEAERLAAEKAAAEKAKAEADKALADAMNAANRNKFIDWLMGIIDGIREALNWRNK